MENSGTASDSKPTIVENGSDPPDVSSTKVSTESIVEGDVKKEASKGEEENSSVGEMKGVAEETEGITDLKNGVDKKDDEEAAVENKNSVEKKYSGDENEPRNTEDREEKRDFRQVKEFEGIEDGKSKEEAEKTQESKKNKEIEETVYLEGQKDAEEARHGLETKDRRETNEVEGKKGGVDTNEVEEKKDVIETIVLEKQKDPKEAKVGEEDKLRDDEKGFKEIKDEEGEKIVEKIKHDEESRVVEGVSAEESSAAEAREDTGGKDDMQVLNNAKDDGEKNDISDVKVTGQKEVVEEGKVHKDVNNVGLLDDSKNEEVAHEINDDGQKRDADDENVTGNISKLLKNKGAKAKKKPKTISKVEAANVKKKATVGEKSEENEFNSGLEKGKEGNAEGEDVVDEEDDDGDKDEQSPSKKAVMSFNKKRARGERSRKKGEVKGKTEGKEKKESGKKAKEPLITPVEASSSPAISSRERPVRERKVVERLVEVIEKEPNKAVIIEKGRGTTLKDIPNVAYKLARKKPVDLKFLHQILFGRRGKTVEFKNHILQFSGFSWHENEEKQRAKIKEKLDKCVKDDLLDICDLLDLTLSKTSTKKEEIIAKLVEFLEAPHATTDVILAEKDQSEKSRKRKRPTGSASRSSGGTSATKSRRRGAKTEVIPKSKGKTSEDKGDGTEDEGTKNDVTDDEDDAPRHSESDAKENESAEASDGGDENDDVDEKENEDVVPSPEKQSSAVRERRKTGSDSKKVSPQTEAKSPVKTKQSKVKKDDAGEKVFTRRKKKVSESPEASDDEGGNEDADDPGKINEDIKQSPKAQVSSVSKKRKRTPAKSKKASLQTVAKSPVKTPSSNKQSKVEKDDTSEKVFTRKKKDVGSPKKSNLKKENPSGKKSGKGKAASVEQRKSGPSKSDLRKTICEILKEVDFNTATFTDILKKLAAHFKTDLTPKKAAIKQMIQEELTKMADEAEDSEDEGETEDAAKEESPKPAAKKAKA